LVAAKLTWRPVATADALGNTTQFAYYIKRERFYGWLR
jgi:hypothetical protein